MEPPALLLDEPHVHELDGRHGQVADARRQPDPFAVGELVAVVPCFQGWGGRAKDDGDGRQLGPLDGHVPGVEPRRLLVLEAGLLLFVDDDQAEFRARREHRASRPDDDPLFASGKRRPGERPLHTRQAAVDHGHVLESAGQTVDELGRERDFRDQENRLLATGEHIADRTNVNFGLAAAADAEQQHGAKRAARSDLPDPLDRPPLCRVQLEGRFVTRLIEVRRRRRLAMRLHLDERRLDHGGEDRLARARLGQQAVQLTTVPVVGQQVDHFLPLGGTKFLGFALLAGSGREPVHADRAEPALLADRLRDHGRQRAAQRAPVVA